MGWSLRDLGGGYFEVEGCTYATFVAGIDQVAEAERDDLLGTFGHGRVRTDETRWWWQRHVAATGKRIAMKRLRGYEAIFQKMVEEWPVERRLKGVKPAQRLAGLEAKEILLALPDEVLQALREEYVRSLPRALQGAIRKRTAGEQAASQRRTGGPARA
jgi:hypothetical protein